MDMKKTALLLIDLQKESGTSNVVGMNDIVKNAKTLVSICRKHGIPIIYTRHISRADAIGLANKEPVNENGEPIYYHSGTDTIEIIDEIKPQENDIIVDKYRYSGFYESSLDLMLKSLDVKHLIIGGVLTDCCVLATVLDAYYRDYQVNLVKDICGTTTTGAHMAATLMMANWIYDLKVYDTTHIVKRLIGEEHHGWEATCPDQLQFSPNNLKEIYSKLSLEKL
ncbi:cysteine hydrolase family protein [Peribacillus huizhouensis]|uniref:Nicotinamidase-related amidase n=1 Tax=Peribacillus huizhouensis TaxID=1501239 RepID=A0ABR6CTQ9_9BACI|nr:isochorismatase family cysteine hydrolase [Peribacillus huizhouensis]MBA9028409.1 nicotinamidase-related amidase [Peribacillus huizhouensis]